MGEWISGYIIEDGMMANKSFTPLDSFPYFGNYDYNAWYGDYNEWITTPEYHFYINRIDVMADMDEIINTAGITYSNEKLASIPLYDDQGAVSGHFVLYLSKTDWNAYVLSAKIQNSSGVNLFDFNSSVCYTYLQSGGIWDDGSTIEQYLGLFIKEDSGRKFIGMYMNFCQLTNVAWGGEYGCHPYFSGFYFAADWCYSALGISVAGIGDPTYESPEFGKPAKKKGGYNPDHSRKGTFDDSSDTITPSSAPTLSAFTSGLVHAYKVTDAELALLSEAMYPDLIFNATSVTDALGSLFNAIFMSKFVDYMLDLMILPINVPAPTSENMKVGGKTLTVSSGSGSTSHISTHRVSQQYVDINCGSLTIPEYWANFLDFSGTRFKLFLPYIGYIDIQPEYINGGELKVKYRFNVLDGSFICFVSSTSGHSKLYESLIGQYSGVAVMHIPLQSTDYSNKVSGLISSMGAVAAGAAGGGMSGAVGYGAAASMVNTVIAKPASAHANGYNASSSFLSHRKPYLIIERQSSQFSEKYPEEVGLPLYVKATINDCHGLTVCENPHLDTIPATMEEKERIHKYLTEGIIV